MSKIEKIQEENESNFSLGPVDLTLKKGETTFIVGGNGSGKSTFLKLLTGLYPPKKGLITLDSAFFCFKKFYWDSKLE